MCRETMPDQADELLWPLHNERISSPKHWNTVNHEQVPAPPIFPKIFRPAVELPAVCLNT